MGATTKEAPVASKEEKEKKGKRKEADPLSHSIDPLARLLSNGTLGTPVEFFFSAEKFFYLRLISVEMFWGFGGFFWRWGFFQ